MNKQTDAKFLPSSIKFSKKISICSHFKLRIQLFSTEPWLFVKITLLNNYTLDSFFQIYFLNIIWIVLPILMLKIFRLAENIILWMSFEDSLLWKFSLKTILDRECHFSWFFKLKRFIKFFSHWPFSRFGIFAASMIVNDHKRFLRGWVVFLIWVRNKICIKFNG